MKKKQPSQQQQDDLSRLSALPDQEIDTLDIPEIPTEKLALAERGSFYRALKQPVTIRLDADVVQWFKDHAAGGKYQSEINRVLRRHVIESGKRRA